MNRSRRVRTQLPMLQISLLGWVLVITSGLFTACATHPKNQEPSPKQKCFAYYQERLKSRDMIWGFGESGVRTVAVDAARTDLVKQISVHVSSSSQLQESNTDVQITSLSRSMIDRSMDGIEVDRVCEGRGRYQAIVKLARTTLLRSVETQLNGVKHEAQDISQQLSKNASLAEQMRNFVLARDFLTKEADAYHSYLAICLAFQGCRQHDSTWLAEIRSFLRLNAPTVAFTYYPEDELAAELQSELSSIIRGEGYRLSADPQPYLASVRCTQTNFDPNQQIRERLVRIHCQVSGEIEAIEIFQFSISATGSGANVERAFGVARTILSKDRP